MRTWEYDEWFSRAVRLCAQVIIQDDRCPVEFDWITAPGMRTRNAHLLLGCPPGEGLGESEATVKALAVNVAMVCYPWVAGRYEQPEPPFVTKVLKMHGLAPVHHIGVSRGHPLYVVSWADHSAAWWRGLARGTDPECTRGNDVTVAEAGGFTMEQLRDLLGRDPEVWERATLPGSPA